MRMTLKATVARISSMLRGRCGYFDQGPVITIYDLIHRYTERRIRRWLLRRSGRKGSGFGQIPDEYLYETLGLYTVPRNRSDLPRAKI
jgi:RNA-directed DNA polymerase